jgi:hypothetical protein
MDPNINPEEHNRLDPASQWPPPPTLVPGKSTPAKTLLTLQKWSDISLGGIVGFFFPPASAILASSTAVNFYSPLYSWLIFPGSYFLAFFFLGIVAWFLHKKYKLLSISMFVGILCSLFPLAVGVWAIENLLTVPK